MLLILLFVGVDDIAIDTSSVTPGYCLAVVNDFAVVDLCCVLFFCLLLLLRTSRVLMYVICLSPITFPARARYPIIFSTHSLLFAHTSSPHIIICPTHCLSFDLGILLLCYRYDFPFPLHIIICPRDIPPIFVFSIIHYYCPHTYPSLIDLCDEY